MLQTLCKSLRATESQQAHDAAESWAWAPKESMKSEFCMKREDRQHCNCWYDGKPCCSCGDAMTFGDAIQVMKDSDQKVRRAGWNGKGMWLGLQTPDSNSKMGHPYIFMSDVNGKLFPWNPNQLDMLSEDWEVCE